MLRRTSSIAMLNGPERGVESSMTIRSENTSLDFLKNFRSRNRRIGRSGDRSPNHKIVRAGTDGLRGCHDAFLIMLIAPTRANSGNDQFYILANCFSQRAGFLGAGN